MLKVHVRGTCQIKCASHVFLFNWLFVYKLFTFCFSCIAARFGLVTERVRLVLSLLILIKVSIPIEFLSVY